MMDCSSCEIASLSAAGGEQLFRRSTDRLPRRLLRLRYIRLRQ